MAKDKVPQPPAAICTLLNRLRYIELERAAIVFALGVAGHQVNPSGIPPEYYEGSLAHPPGRSEE